MAIAQVFQIVALIFSSCSLCCNFAYLALKYRAGLNSIRSTQHRYRVLTMVLATCLVLTGTVDMICTFMVPNLNWKMKDTSILGLFSTMFAQPAFICYVNIILERYKKMITKGEHVFFNTKNANILNIILNVGGIFGYTGSFSAAIASSPNDSATLMEPSQYTTIYNVFLSIANVSAVLATLWLIFLETSVNFTLAYHAFDIKNKGMPEIKDHEKRRLKWKVYGYLAFLFSNDILLVVLFAIANARIIPRVETLVICYSWVCIHFMMAFQFLDLLMFLMKTGKLFKLKPDFPGTAMKGAALIGDAKLGALPNSLQTEIISSEFPSTSHGPGVMDGPISTSRDFADSSIQGSSRY